MEAVLFNIQAFHISQYHCHKFID